MKGFNVTLILLFVALVMGGSLYWVLREAPEFQAESAQAMKLSFLAVGPVEIEPTPTEQWSFSADPEAWTFEVQGSLLKIQPPAPVIRTELKLNESSPIHEMGAWPSVRLSLEQEAIRRLHLKTGPQSSTQVEIQSPQGFLTQ